MTIEFKPSPKQNLIFDYFNDKYTTEILYGGSVSSGKTYALCALLVMKCLQYPGIRVGLARQRLTTLKRNTVSTLLKLLRDWQLSADKHFKYNQQSGELTFFNDSKILLCELAYNPSDPEYTRIGGLEITFGAIDEAGETHEKGKEIFQSRIGRWLNDKYDIKPLLFLTCNPTKNFLFRDFYMPQKEHKMPEHRKFIQALPQDNPYVSQAYLDNLDRTLSHLEKRRLLYGDWEVHDDSEALFAYEDIVYLYEDDSLDRGDKQMRLSCDIAFTLDECVFVVWEGKTIVKIIKKDKMVKTTVVDTIKKICDEYKIRYDHVAWDADGVGLYLREHFPGGKEIHNGSKPIKNDGYRNLKTELFFTLSEKVKKGEVKIKEENYSSEVMDQLSVIKHKPRHTGDNKIELIPKAEMVRILGHSPDIADAMAYGMIFHLKSGVLEPTDIVFIGF